MLHIKVVEKIETHFMFNNFFFKSCHLWDNEEKHSRAGQAIDDNTAHAHCMLDATNTHSEYVMLIAFSTETMVARKVLNTTFIRKKCPALFSPISNYLLSDCVLKGLIAFPFPACKRTTVKFLSPTFLYHPPLALSQRLDMYFPSLLFSYRESRV